MACEIELTRQTSKKMISIYEYSFLHPHPLVKQVVIIVTSFIILFSFALVSKDVFLMYISNIDDRGSCSLFGMESEWMKIHPSIQKT